MRFVVIFDDSTEMAVERNRLEPDHLHSHCRYLEGTISPVAISLKNCCGATV